MLLGLFLFLILVVIGLVLVYIVRERKKGSKSSNTTTGTDKSPVGEDQETVGLLNYEEFGLLVRKTRDAFPLKSFSIKAKVVDVFSEVTITQTFDNFESPTDAIFAFPTTESAITSFELRLPSGKILMKVEDKNVVQKNYSEFLSEEMGPYVGDLKEDALFQLTLGELPPNDPIIITIKYVKEISTNKDDEFIFVVPEQLFPRSAWCPYDFEADFEITAGLKRINCLSHPTAGIEINPTNGHGYVRFHRETSMADREIRVVAEAQTSQPTCIVEVNKELGTQAALLTFAPNWDSIEKNLIDLKSEIIFLVDRSISMKGSNMDLAKEMLHHFLRSIPAETLFNIVGFGSQSHWLFPESKLYDDNTLRLANDYLKMMGSDLGGSEISRPLEKIFALPINPQYPRHLFILTDGQVYDREKVIGLVKRASDYIRVFSFGVGDDVDAALVKGLAEAGKGQCEFISQKEKIEKSVLRMLHNVMQPKLSGIQIDWSAVGDITQSPYCIPCVFNKKRLNVFGLIKSNGKQPESLILTGFGPQNQSQKIPVKIIWREGSDIHKLAAFLLISNLQQGTAEIHFELKAKLASLHDSAEGPQVQNQVDNISKERASFLAKMYQLPSKFTSFITFAQDESNPKITDVVGLQFYQQDALRPIEINISKSMISRRYSIVQARRSSIVIPSGEFGRPPSMTDLGNLKRASSASLDSIQLPTKGNRKWLSAGDVLPMQYANGRWSQSFLQAFSSTYNLPLETIWGGFPLLKEAPQDKKTDWEDFFATSLAIGFLNMSCSQSKSEWHLCVLKAERWIAQIKESNAMLKEVDSIKMATDFLASHSFKPWFFQKFIHRLSSLVRKLLRRVWPAKKKQE